MADKIYTTIAGDTWDQLAYKFYGNSKLMTPLLEANRGHVKTIVFEAGVTLVIPIAEVKQNGNIAPWRR